MNCTFLPFLRKFIFSGSLWRDFRIALKGATLLYCLNNRKRRDLASEFEEKLFRESLIQDLVNTKGLRHRLRHRNTEITENETGFAIESEAVVTSGLSAEPYAGTFESGLCEKSVRVWVLSLPKLLCMMVPLVHENNYSDADN